MIGVEFASWFFEFPEKNAGSSENSVSYNTCHWSFFLEIIVQEKFWGCKEFLRQNCVYGMQQRNIFLCGEMLLTLPYPFICFRCLYVSVYGRLQRGYFFEKCKCCHSVRGTDAKWCKERQPDPASLIPVSFANLYRPMHYHRLGSKILAFIAVLLVCSSVFNQNQLSSDIFP